MGNDIVFYSQEDKRWRSTLYSIRNDSKQTIGTSACGPTCFAMIAATWRDKSIIPPETARFAVERGYRTPDSGTAWAYFASAAKHYGLTCKQTGGLDEVKQALSDGALVIASMGPGHVTGGGHYILLVGVNGKWISVFDPNHDNTKYGNDGLIKQGIKDDGKIEADELVFKREARQYWIFPKPVKNEEVDEDMKEVESLRKEVADVKVMQEGYKLALEDVVRRMEKATESIPAPKWFITEFGDGVLKKIKNQPYRSDL